MIKTNIRIEADRTGAHRHLEFNQLEGPSGKQRDLMQIRTGLGRRSAGIALVSRSHSDCFCARAGLWLAGACVVAALSSVTRAVADCVPAPAGIIGFWEGDGNAIDVVGGNNGILTSNATATAVGMVGSAFSLNGTTSFIQIPDSPVLHPTNFTIEAWVNFASLNSTTSGGAGVGEQYIVFKQNTRSSSFEGFALEKVTNSSAQHVFHFVVIGAAGPPSATINSTTAISTNVWYHVAAVRGSNYLQLYVNGSLQAQTTVAFPQDYGTLPLYFGTTGQTYDGKFNGRLDEVSLYNRALSSDEIASIFAAGASGKCRPPPNDAFANATPLTGVSNTFTASNVNATQQPRETTLPTFQPSGGASVWWSFTPPDNGTLTVSLDTNFAFPFLVSAYQGNSVSNLVLLGASVRDLGSEFLEQELSIMSCDVSKSVPCYIDVDTYDGASDAGAFSLTVQYTGAPSNDAFAARTPISSTAASISGSNVAASLEPGEPAHSGKQPGRSVWWSWQPTNSGPVTLSTYGSTFDTILDVYTNSVLSNLSLVAGNDDCFTFSTTNGPTNDPSSRVFINAVAGTTYQIAVSGANSNSGNVSLNFVTVAIDNILSVQRTVESDSSVDFTANLDITNFRSSGTGPLRIELVARAGYAYDQYLADDSSSFLNMLDAPDEGIGTIALPPPGALTGRTSTQVQVSGHCDPPYLSGDSSWGFGRVVIAVLEEQVGGVWVQADARLMLAGEWPPVGGFNGPGGGVITLNSGFGVGASNPGYLQVTLGPPLAIRMGGAWRVSPTNFGALGELRFYTNFTTNSYTLSVLSSNFSIEVVPLPVLISPSNQALTITPGTVVPLDLFYSVSPPRLTYSRTNGLAITAPTPGTSYGIQTASPSQISQGSWSLFTNITLANTNLTRISNTTPSKLSNLFYRAVWLSQ